MTISKKRFNEKYGSYDKVCQFSALWGVLWQICLEKLTNREQAGHFIHQTMCVSKTTCYKEKNIMT